MKKLNNLEVAGEDEVTGKMIKSWDELMMVRIWKFHNMALERGSLQEDWTADVIVQLYEG